MTIPSWGVAYRSLLYRFAPSKASTHVVLVLPLLQLLSKTTA